MQLAAQLLQAFKAQNIGTARSGTICRNRFQPCQPLADVFANRVLSLRSEARPGASRRIHHVPGINNHRRNLHDFVQPPVSLTHMLQKQFRLVARRTQISVAATDQRFGNRVAFSCSVLVTKDQRRFCQRRLGPIRFGRLAVSLPQCLLAK